MANLHKDYNISDIGQSGSLKLRTTQSDSESFEFMCDGHPLDAYSYHDSPTEALNVSEILNIQTELNSRIYNFYELRNISLEEVLASKDSETNISPAEEKKLVLKQIIESTCKRWKEMKERGHDVEEDPPEQLLDMLTKESAEVAVLRAIPHGESDKLSTKDKYFAGYALVFNDKKDFPDLSDLPQEIAARDDIARGSRLFVNSLGNMLAPRGKAVQLLMEQIYKVTGEKSIYTKILIEPKELAYRWSRDALERVGFYDSGMRCSQSTNAVDKDGNPIADKVVFAWYVYSPTEDQGIRKINEYKKRISELESHAVAKFAETFAVFNPGGSVLSVYSKSTREEDILQLAAVQPDNFIISVDLEKKGTPDYRYNVKHIPLQRAETDFKPGIFEGVLNLNILPAVIEEKKSATPEATAEEIAVAFLKMQKDTLTTGSRLLLREWAAPSLWPEQIVIELSSTDGNNSGPTDNPSVVSGLSTARRFEAYACQSSDTEIKEIVSSKPGFRSFITSKKNALSYALIKDYTFESDWRREIKNKVQFTDQQLSDLTEKAGLRNIALEPRHNKIIYQNSFDGKINFKTIAGEELQYPPTMYILIAEKTEPEAGVKFVESRLIEQADTEYVKISTYRNTETNKVRNIASRPFDTAEIHITFTDERGRFVIFKDAFPRPGFISRSNSAPLDGSKSFGYVAEPLFTFIDNKKDFKEQILEALKVRARISADQIISISDASPYFTSVGSNTELVRRVFVNVTPRELTDIPAENYSGFADSGRIKAVREDRLLASVQLGCMGDDRIARNIYEQRLAEGIPLGPWLEKIPATDQQIDLSRVVDAAEFLHKQFHNYQPGLWENADPAIEKSRNYFSVFKGTFEEYDQNDKLLAVSEREFVRPNPAENISSNSVITIPFIKSGGKIYIIPEIRDDLPAPYFELNMPLFVTEYGFRIPDNTKDADTYVCQQLQNRYNIKSLNEKLADLGRWYAPSSGLLAERVWVKAVEVSAADSSVNLIELQDLVNNRDKIHGGHFLTAVFRLYHAFSDGQKLE